MSAKLQPSPLLRWLLTALMFVFASIYLWTGFFRFQWVGFLCFGLYLLIGLPNQGNSQQRRSRTRAIAIGILLAVAIVAFGCDLYLMYRS